MSVVVVGAGLAGLRIASELDDVILLESRSVPGGRVRTSYDISGVVEYEAGPWRIPGDHTRVRSLFEREGLTLVPLATPSVHTSRAPSVRPGVSIWDANVLQFDTSPPYADMADLATGYADQTSAASGSSPYTTASGAFSVCPSGFTSLVSKLSERVRDVRYDHRVVDVFVDVHGYSVHVSQRVSSTCFKSYVIRCATLFVCVPPSVSRDWTALRDHARSTMCSVTGGELCHVYVKHDAMPSHTHHLNPDSILSQTVSSQYGNSWFQASYSGGRIARFWKHLHNHDVTMFWSTLRNALYRWYGIHVPRDTEHRFHHWPCAYHQWLPVPSFDMRRAVYNAIEPNPSVLPRLFIAGEAFSSHQAWMEGALETAELALVRYHGSGGGVFPASDSDTRIDGCPIDVSRWCKSHPGGESALLNHTGEDMGVYMRHIGHSDGAWAIAHSLKR